MDVRADATRLWLALEELVFVTVAPMLSGVDLANRRGKARKMFTEAVVGLDRAFRAEPDPTGCKPHGLLDCVICGKT